MEVTDFVDITTNSPRLWTLSWASSL